MKKPIKIGIVAPSSKVPRVELNLGVKRIRQEGFTVEIHPHCLKSHLFFSGTDDERTSAFFEYAKSEEHSVVWCARGGHGAIRMLPLLENLTKIKGVPQKKLLVGYSDVTALMEFVRKNWGWSTLHAPMPSLRKFSILGPDDWSAMTHWIQGKSAIAPWKDQKLEFWTNSPKSTLQAKVVGGNLTVWNCLVGTRFQGQADGCILFLEDVDESLYRIDRMLQQLLLSGRLDRIQAIVLGNFMNCKDHSPMVLKSAPNPKNKARVLSAPKPSELKPLRKTLKEIQALKQMFTELGQALKIPVAFGLPVGHGPEVSPMPLGAEYELTPDGQFNLMNWDWTDRVI